MTRWNLHLLSMSAPKRDGEYKKNEVKWVRQSDSHRKEIEIERVCMCVHERREKKWKTRGQLNFIEWNMKMMTNQNFPSAGSRIHAQTTPPPAAWRHLEMMLQSLKGNLHKFKLWFFFVRFSNNLMPSFRARRESLTRNTQVTSTIDSRESVLWLLA